MNIFPYFCSLEEESITTTESAKKLNPPQSRFRDLVDLVVEIGWVLWR